MTQLLLIGGGLILLFVLTWLGAELGHRVGMWEHYRRNK
jgi:hypothetical protein